MRTVKRSMYILLAGSVIVWLVGCGGISSGGAKGSTTIKVCTEFPVSGVETGAGKPAENGATLAIDLANAGHTIPGYTLVAVHYDDVGPDGHNDPTTGANNIRAAIGDALIAGCIGPFNSSVAEAEMPLANQAPLALISPTNSTPSLTKPAYGQLGTLRPTGKVTYFRITTTDDKQGPAGANYLYKKLGRTRVYIIDDTETFGKGLADEFEKAWRNLGGTVLGHVGLDKTTTDFKPTLTAAAALHPDAIYYSGSDTNGGTLARKQMAQVPGLHNTVFFGGDSLLTYSFIKATGAAGIGTIVTVPSVNPDILPTGAQFKSDFTAKFPNASDYASYSANSYDAANILILAIKRALDKGVSNPKDSSDTDGAKAFRQAVIDQIAKTDYNGVTGHTTFDENGDTTNRVISIYKAGSDGWDFVEQFNV